MRVINKTISEKNTHAVESPDYEQKYETARVKVFILF